MANAANDMKDPAIRAHVRELAVIIYQCSVKHGVSVDEVITWLLEAAKKEESA